MSGEADSCVCFARTIERGKQSLKYSSASPSTIQRMSRDVQRSESRANWVGESNPVWDGGFVSPCLTGVDFLRLKSNILPENISHKYAQGLPACLRRRSTSFLNPFLRLRGRESDRPGQRDQKVVAGTRRIEMILRSRSVPLQGGSHLVSQIDMILGMGGGVGCGRGVGRRRRVYVRRPMSHSGLAASHPWPQ